MQLRIKHKLSYAYSQPVFCEPLTLRFRPRDDPRQKLLEHSLHIDPVPVGRSEYVDLEGNAGATIWFSHVVQSLTFSATSIVETSEASQFEFLLKQEVLGLPLVYAAEIEPVLQPYRSNAGDSPQATQLAREVAAAMNQQTVPFLVELNNRINATCRQIIRMTGDAWPPDVTLSRGEGACRDLAALFIAACRSQGLAARLVSGYHAQPDPDQQHHLHAWCEVYLPGGGWRGFDPTCGLAVTNRHVAVAAGLSPNLVAPTFGTFLGLGANAILTADVSVESV
jgi:transglutaminase-like putative cysteine protease